jgi:poly-gamma-glutamate synthesis protein (capsule biosynthesis protein)
MDTTEVKRDLTEAGMHNPDFIISVMHWGKEYKLSSSFRQKKWEKFLYRHGTDLIIGAHPHVPQEIKIYKDSSGKIEHMTAFSLGNAISNMTARNTRMGMMLEITLTKEKQTSRTGIANPVTHWIWTSRPSSTKGYYTIIPVEEYLKNPLRYNIREEKSLIEYYYQDFSKRFVQPD